MNFSLVLSKFKNEVRVMVDIVKHGTYTDKAGNFFQYTFPESFNVYWEIGKVSLRSNHKGLRVACGHKRKIDSNK